MTPATRARAAHTKTRSSAWRPANIAPADATRRSATPSETVRLGKVLIAATERGLCSVILGDSERELARQLRAQFPLAKIQPEPRLASMLAQVVSQFSEHPATLDLPLDLRATAFQMRVWEALRRIPRGETRSYAQLARFARPADRGARRGPRLCDESRGRGRAVPPRHRQQRQAYRLSLGCGAEEEAAGDRERYSRSSVVAGTRGKTARNRGETCMPQRPLRERLELLARPNHSQSVQIIANHYGDRGIGGELRVHDERGPHLSCHERDR